MIRRWRLKRADRRYSDLADAYGMALAFFPRYHPREIEEKYFKAKWHYEALREQHLRARLVQR